MAALEHTSPSTPANTIGKLVTAKKWYFAAVMSKADADRLNLGGSATLDFPQHYSGTVSATVFSKSEPDSSGEVAVVFAWQQCAGRHAGHAQGHGRRRLQ